MKGISARLAAAFLALCMYGCAVQKPRVLVIQGFRPATDAAASVRAMKYLPLDVPAGVTSIRIHRDITWKNGPPGIVDQGLFDSRGLQWGGAGFRGWQGGIKGDIVLSGYTQTSEAHYLAGPIPRGRWWIVQSFLKTPGGGFDYRYTVTLRFDGKKPPRKMAPVPRYEPGVLRPGPGWFAGNLHNHTIHSDGANTLEEVAQLNRQAGYDFIAATDHNTYRQDYEVASAAAANPGLLILFGEEITTPSGHSNVIGKQPGTLFDFRMDGGDGHYPLDVAKAHQQGAIIEVNHPYAPCLTCYWRFPRSEYAGVNGIEVWNGDWGLDDRLSVSAWDRLLKAGKHFCAYGGSDYHRPGTAMSPATWVYAQNLSRDAIIDGLRRGHVVVSINPQGPMIEMSIAGQPVLPGDTIKAATHQPLPLRIRVLRGAGARLEIIWKDGSGEIPVKTADETISRTLNVDSDHFYVRAQLIGNDKMLALTNPIFVDGK